MDSERSYRIARVALAVSIVGTLIALGSYFFSWQNTILSKESNEIAREAYSLAEKAQQPQISTNLRTPYRGYTIVLAGLNYPISYCVTVRAEVDLIISNNGGAYDSLKEIEVTLQVPWAEPSKPLLREEQTRLWDAYGREIVLPYDVPPGVSRRLTIRRSLIYGGVAGVPCDLENQKSRCEEMAKSERRTALWGLKFRSHEVTIMDSDVYWHVGAERIIEHGGQISGTTYTPLVNRLATFYIPQSASPWGEDFYGEDFYSVDWCSRLLTGSLVGLRGEVVE